jgi:hypothetical protein
VLDHPPRPHHGDVVGDQPDDGEILRDEQVAQPQFGPVADTARAQWFGDQSLYGEHRIERGVRILEDRCGWPARSPAAAHRSRR